MWNVVGPVCAVCSGGYAYRSATHQCEECSPSSAIDALTVLIILSLVLLAAIGGCLHLRKIKGLTHLYIIVFTKLGFIGEQTKHPERKAQFIARRFMSWLKIYITLWQIVSIMPFALDLQFPDVYSAILAALRAFNIDVSRSVLVTCSTGSSFDAIDTLVVDTLYPVVVVVLLWFIHWIHLHKMQGHNQDTVALVGANYHKAFLVFTYLILPSTSATIFQVFSCKDVDPDNVASGDDYYMAMDYSVSCSSSKYHFGFAWAIASILVYPIGIPAYYFYVLYNARIDIQHRDDIDTITADEAQQSESNMLDDPKLQAIQLLFESYQPRYWYWEVIETAKRLLLTGVLVLIVQGSAVQIIVGISFSLFFMKLYDTYRPYADNAIQGFQSISQWQIFTIFLIALLLKADFGSIDIIALDVCLILAIFANFVIALCRLVAWRCQVAMQGEAVRGREDGDAMRYESESPLTKYAGNVVDPKAATGDKNEAAATDTDDCAAYLGSSGHGANQGGDDGEGDSDDDADVAASLGAVEGVMMRTMSRVDDV
jgi:hypothetical protein